MLGKRTAARHPGAGMAVLALLVMSSVALADRVNFTVFNNDEGADVSGVDLWVDVTENIDTIDMVFHNDSNSSAVVTQIYFEAPLAGLLSNGRIHTSSDGVRFKDGATPQSPPGGQNIGWEGEMYSVGRVARGGVSNGIDGDAIDPDESLTVRFDRLESAALADLLEMLNDGGRIAQYVQRLPDFDQSVSTTTAVSAPIPAAGAAGAALLGALGIAQCVRKRRRGRENE